VDHMRAFAFIASAVALLFATACGSGEMSCQSGPKYGTQCYNAGQQPIYATSGRSSPSASGAQSAPSTPMPASTR